MDTDTAVLTETDHVVSEPPILYFGTPVVLVSTTNPDGSANLAPMSSVWWLGWRAVLGLDATSQTVANLRRTGEAVLNLPDESLVDAVDRIARTTGSDPLPGHKVRRGYRHVADKFAEAGLTARDAHVVGPPRVHECPVQLEGVVEGMHPLGAGHDDMSGRTFAVEVRIVRTHLHPDVLADGGSDRVDPDRWRPLISSFQRFYGLTPHEVAPSRLAEIPESLYRSPDLDRVCS